jgi:hypothetical protein
MRKVLLFVVAFGWILLAYCGIGMAHYSASVESVLGDYRLTGVEKQSIQNEDGKVVRNSFVTGDSMSIYWVDSFAAMLNGQIGLRIWVEGLKEWFGAEVVSDGAKGFIYGQTEDKTMHLVGLFDARNGQVKMISLSIFGYGQEGVSISTLRAVKTKAPPKQFE